MPSIPIEIVIVSPQRRAKLKAKYFDKLNDVTDWAGQIFAFSALPQKISEVLMALKSIDQHNPQAQKIIFSKDLRSQDISELWNSSPNLYLVSDIHSPDFEKALDFASKKIRRQKAHTSDSEQKDFRAIKRSQSRSKQVETLHQAMTAVHNADSIGQIETRLLSALGELLKLSWVRIFFHINENLEGQLQNLSGLSLFRADLNIGGKNLGRIVFARDSRLDFTRTEKVALEQIAESVTLALDRLAKLDMAENLKHQWDSTFDAISDPLCLTDDQFHIIKINQAFKNITGLPINQIIGVNCLLAFCGTQTPLKPLTESSWIIEKRILTDTEPRKYEVQTQKIKWSDDAAPILLTLFHDVTDQKKIEKQIFETAKMAELGTIGSSIAHDINNPLGGMINFLQLIKMGLKVDDPILDDIDQMLAAGMRCKEIVENLLRFTRKQEEQEKERIDLRHVLQETLKLIELQSRSLGITADLQIPEDPVMMMGHFNLLSQAFSHLMQNASDAVAEKLKSSPGSEGKIEIRLSSPPKDSKNTIVLTIRDNGVGISPEILSRIFNPMFTTKSGKPGLGLTLAYQIFHDHHGNLELSSQPNIGTEVKITFKNV